MNVDITSLGKRLFTNFKNYLDSSLEGIIKVPIRQYAVENQYPLVVFEENTNIDTSHTIDRYRMNSTRGLSYTITILAVDTPNMTSYEICNLIASHVANIMENGFNMTGGINSKFSNINSSKATRWVFKYTCTWDIVNDVIY